MTFKFNNSSKGTLLEQPNNSYCDTNNTYQSNKCGI